MHPVCHTCGIFRLEREARLLFQTTGPEFKDVLPQIDAGIPEGDKLEDKILTYLSTDGIIDVQEIADLRSMLIERLRRLPGLTLPQFNALVDGFPAEDGDTILQMAEEAGVLNREKMLNAIREGSMNKPIAPEEPLTRSAAPAAVPEAPSAPPAVVPDAGALRMGISQAKENMEAYERARVNLVRQHRAAMYNLRGPAREMARARMASEVQQLRMQFGDPVGQYWASRGMYEQVTGTSYVRELYEEQGKAVTEHPPQQRRINIIDRSTGKNLAVFDEWNCNYVGMMPREEVVRLIDDHYADIRDTGAGRAVLPVDGTMYLASAGRSGGNAPSGLRFSSSQFSMMRNNPYYKPVYAANLLRDSEVDRIMGETDPHWTPGISAGLKQLGHASDDNFMMHVYDASRVGAFINPYLVSTSISFDGTRGGVNAPGALYEGMDANLLPYYQRMGGAKYIQEQNRLRASYVPELLQEVEERLDRYQNDPAYPQLKRAYERAKVFHWPNNPGRVYGDLAVMRSNIEEMDRRAQYRAYDERALASLRRSPNGEILAYETMSIRPLETTFGPQDKIVIRIPPGTPGYNGRQEHVIIYEPFTEIGVTQGSRELLAKLGIFIERGYSALETYKHGSHRNRPRVDDVTIYFTRPLEGVSVNGKIISARGKLHPTGPMAASPVVDTNNAKPVTSVEELLERFGITREQYQSFQELQREWKWNTKDAASRDAKVENGMLIMRRKMEDGSWEEVAIQKNGTIVPATESPSASVPPQPRQWLRTIFDRWLGPVSSAAAPAPSTDAAETSPSEEEDLNRLRDSVRELEE